MKLTKYYFCYGDLVAPKYENFIGNSPMKKVFSIGTTKKNIHWISDKYIIYATGKWSKTATPFIEVIDPDTRLYDSQKNIFKYLTSIGNTQEVIFRPNNTPGLNDIPFGPVRMD